MRVWHRDHWKAMGGKGMGCKLMTKRWTTQCKHVLYKWTQSKPFPTLLHFSGKFWWPLVLSAHQGLRKATPDSGCSQALITKESFQDFHCLHLCVCVGLWSILTEHTQWAYCKSVTQPPWLLLLTHDSQTHSPLTPRVTQCRLVQVKNDEKVALIRLGQRPYLYDK